MCSEKFFCESIWTWSFLCWIVFNYRTNFFNIYRIIQICLSACVNFAVSQGMYLFYLSCQIYWHKVLMIFFCHLSNIFRIWWEFHFFVNLMWILLMLICYFCLFIFTSLARGLLVLLIFSNNYLLSTFMCVAMLNFNNTHLYYFLCSVFFRFSSLLLF